MIRNIFSKNKYAKSAAQTVLFYIVLFSLISLLEKVSPGGPCVPGGGFLAMMLSVPLILILVIVNIVKISAGEKQHRVSLLIHFALLLTLAILVTRK